jgi:RHS repeat-associated protein
VGSSTRTLTVPSGNPGSINFTFSAGYTWEYSKNGGTFTTLTNGGSVSFANNNTIAVKLFGIGCSDGDTLTATDATTGASVGTFDASNTGTCSGQSPQFGGPNTPSSTVTIFSVWDGDWAILEEYDAHGNRVQGYLQGYHGLVKTLVDNIYYYQDELGSTSHIASSSGQLLEYYKYNLYGKPRYFNAAGTEQGASSYRVQDLGNGGSRWIPELSLYDDRNRFMSPDLGRFLQPDPIGFKGDASNLYRYCGNDWANRTDPTGLEMNNTAVDLSTQLLRNGALSGPADREDLRDYAQLTGNVGRIQVFKPDAFTIEAQKVIANGPKFAQNGPQATNGSKRDAIDQIARDTAARGGHEYDYVLNTGTATCSKFVNDTTTRAGAPMRVKDPETHKMRPPTAGEIATQKIAGWRMLGKGEQKLPGDVGAYSIPHHGDYTGHCAIVTSDGHGGITSIGAHYNGVYAGRDHFFENPDAITFQRYIGN